MRAITNACRYDTVSSPGLAPVTPPSETSGASLLRCTGYSAERSIVTLLSAARVTHSGHEVIRPADSRKEDLLNPLNARLVSSGLRPRPSWSRAKITAVQLLADLRTLARR